MLWIYHSKFFNNFVTFLINIRIITKETLNNMKKVNISLVKSGNVVNISLDGKLHQKICGSSQEADTLFRTALKAKENPTDENILAIRGLLNEKTRVAIMAGLENDPETGEVYLAGFNTPIPETLVEVIKEYHENEYPLEPIMNFWKLLMLNPDTRIRTVLFDFIKTHDFVLTDNGYMVVYKAVYEKKNEQDADETRFAEFISNRYLHVKKTWKESPKKHIVYRKIEDDTFNSAQVNTVEKWDEKEKGVEVLGNLQELFDAIFNSGDENEEKKVPVFTDMHTKKMHIELGQPVKQDRKECDADFRRDCSNGLHVGATKYVENFAGSTGKILVCYVNPANVVAVPDYDHSKMRVCEYFPFAIATYEDRKIDVIEQAYFESDYCEYELDELEKQVQKIQAEEPPIEKAINAENDEERPMSELMRIIESRIIDIG